MTLIIGVQCAEGVVLAADSAATMGASGIQTAQQRTARKLTICNQGKAVVGVSGHMGLAQRLAAAIEDGYRNNRFKGRPESAMGFMREAIVPIVKAEYEMGSIVATATRSAAALQYANFAMLAAIPLDKHPQLVSFADIPALALRSAESHRSTRLHTRTPVGRWTGLGVCRSQHALRFALDTNATFRDARRPCRTADASRRRTAFGGIGCPI